MHESPQKLSQLLNYQFKDIQLFELALTHRSVGHKNNERLEYLGDALLGLIIADVIFHQFKDADEGELTRLRANLVKRETLARLARDMELGKYIKLGGGEMKSGGWRRDSILSNTFEALIGAIYLDSDFPACQKCVEHIYRELLQNSSADSIKKDPKTELQEFLQGKKSSLPVYTVIKEDGLAHSREFTVECQVEILDEPVVAVGRSKRNAEQSSAKEALKKLVSMLS